MSATLNVWAGAAILSDVWNRVGKKGTRRNCELQLIERVISQLQTEVWTYSNGYMMAGISRQKMVEERRERLKRMKLADFIFFLLRNGQRAEREGGVLAETEDFYAEGASPTNNRPACPLIWPETLQLLYF